MLKTKKVYLALAILALCTNISAADLATGNLTSSGTVATTCSFSSITPGTLAGGAGNTMATNNAGGTPASVTATYFGLPSVQIATPTVTSGSLSPSSYTLSGTSPGLGTLTPNASGVIGVYTTGAAGSSDVITVNMGLVNGSAIPAGSYTLTSVVTCF